VNALTVTESLLVAMSGTGQQAGYGQLLVFAIILGIFYFLILMPMKKRQKKVEEFQESLKVGDKVVTTGGIYGQITRVSDKSVQLQIADAPTKVRIEIARASVGGYQGQDPVVSDSGNP
jgi:preprotein translocase subunit YajC